MPRFCVLRLERDSGIDESVSFHSSTSQCPPFFGPTKRSFSSLTSLAVARSTALNDLPMDDASPARVKSGLAFSAARIFSGVFTRVSTGISTGVSTGFRGVVTCAGANGNCHPHSDRLHLQHWRGPARLQAGLQHALDPAPPGLYLAAAEKGVGDVRIEGGGRVLGQQSFPRPFRLASMSPRSSSHEARRDE
jgi:hypothetical protein